MHQEGRIQLASQALRRRQIKSVTAAARAYAVPRTTLRSRLNGRVSRDESRANGHKLSRNEEEVLVKWLLDMDDRGYPLTPEKTRAAALLLLKSRVEDLGVTIGVNWVSRFIKRTPQLKGAYSRKYDYVRAKCEDYTLLSAWFELVKNTKAAYGIQDCDTYNFDETGFALGVTATMRVITSSDKARPNLVQPGDREWVTCIETICADGHVLPPYVIFKGKNHQASWYKTFQLPPDWAIGVSPKGWTTNEHGIHWLKTHFERLTASRTQGTWRLLIMDGHESHATPEFDDFARSHRIKVLCMPPHSSHLLQPLDIACFSVLKRAYGLEVSDRIRRGLNHIDKVEFLSALMPARDKAFTHGNCKAGFKATGLVPYDPFTVLSGLVRPLTPPEQQPSIEQHYSPRTPHTLAELHQHQAALHATFQRLSRSPQSPVKSMIAQLVKTAEMSMASATLLASEVEQTRAQNERQKRKRRIQRRYIGQNIAYTVSEASNIASRRLGQDMVADGVVHAEVSTTSSAQYAATTQPFEMFVNTFVSDFTYK